MWISEFEILETPRSRRHTHTLFLLIYYRVRMYRDKRTLKRALCRKTATKSQAFNEISRININVFGNRNTYFIFGFLFIKKFAGVFIVLNASFFFPNTMCVYLHTQTERIKLSSFGQGDCGTTAETLLILKKKKKDEKNLLLPTRERTVENLVEYGALNIYA